MRTLVVYPVPIESQERWDTFWPHVCLFTDEMRRFDPGADYDLIVVPNGISQDWDRTAMKHLFRHLPVQFVPYYGGGYDSGSWQHVSHSFRNCFMVTMTTRCHPYFHGWLKHLVDARTSLGPGIYGTSASHEGGRLHLCARTFGIDTDDFARYPLRLHRDRGVEFEVGINNPVGSLYEWGESQKLKPRVVYRSGVYEKGGWFDAPNIYRRGDQTNLLVWDKHTDAYREADPVRKAELEQMCFNSGPSTQNHPPTS